MPKAVEGFVIEREGSFLDAGNRWREIPVSEAHIHACESIEGIRESFHHCRNKPQRMYRAIKDAEGKTQLLTEAPISFYVASGDDRIFVGDCARLTTT